jgi:predicted LPLAT superfamily acyltransferase
MNSAKVLDAQRWTALPERGTPGALRFMVCFATHIGRTVMRLLVCPIAGYFAVTARPARLASYDYMRRVFGRPARWWHVLRHFYSFAATILDRVYLLRGDFERFSITIHGRDLVYHQLETGKGCILLGSHLGSFEVLRALGVSRQHFPIKVLMDVDHNQNLTRLLDALNPEIAATVITPDQPDTLLRVKESLDAGFFLGMLGDRATANEKITRCNFLDAPATFPAGPILLASMTHSPVILFFGLYRGGNRYEIFFERFADEIVLPRDRRSEEIQEWMQRYVSRLEHYTRSAPYNWFNFYPFWDDKL